MINERIGCFIAAMRKEQKLTQEQLAEKLGVSNRSVSRWENGKTMPDLSLMEELCRILEVTLPELLRGERKAEALEIRETVALVTAMVQREGEQKAREANSCLIPGFLLLSLVLLWEWLTGNAVCTPVGIALSLLGAFLLGMGIFRNSQKESMTDRELDVLFREKEIRMKTAGEMIRFARKYQKPELSQQRKAFEAIEKALAAEEYAVFSMTAGEYSFDGRPGSWNGVLVLTNKRLFLCAETVRGRLTTYYTPEWLEREEIRSLEATPGKIVISGERNTILVKGKNMSEMAEKLKTALER